MIRARVGLRQTDLPVDRAYLDSFSIDISKDFFPVRRAAAAFATFYLACKNAFPRTGARIELIFDVLEHLLRVRDGTATAPTMLAEYFDGSRWLPLGSDHEFADGTAALTKASLPDGRLTRRDLASSVPPDWAEARSTARRQQWLRFRLVGRRLWPASGAHGRARTPTEQASYVVNSDAVHAAAADRRRGWR